MANIYDCALVYTPQLWVEKFHRHCTNTGQLRIRSFIYDSSVLFSDEYEVVIVSDTWPALSRALVEKIKTRGAKIIGICDSTEASREFLSSIGVHGIFDSKLEVNTICDQIIELLDSLNIHTGTQTEINDDLDSLDISSDDDDISKNNIYSYVTSVIGTGGSGTTELSLAINKRLTDSLIVDLDFEHPALAPRANLNIEPHILDAIESAQNNRENFLDAVSNKIGVSALVGLTHSSLATDLRDYEIKSLIDEAKVHFSNLVLDCGTVSQCSSFLYLYETIFSETDTFVIVGGCSPQGIIRILEALVLVEDFINVNELNQSQYNIEIIINNATTERQLQQQIADEILFCSPKCKISFVPTSKEINDMSWMGSLDYPKKWLKHLDGLLIRINNSFKQNKFTIEETFQRPIDELIGETL